MTILNQYNSANELHHIKHFYRGGADNIVPGLTLLIMATLLIKGAEPAESKCISKSWISLYYRGLFLIILQRG